MLNFDKFVAGLVSFSSAFLIAIQANAQTHPLPVGWTLAGNDAGTDVAPPAVFGNATAPVSVSSSITSVWTWDNPNGRWNFYAPSMTASALSSYAGSKGYGILSTIAKGDGFWVSSHSASSVNLSASTSTAAPLRRALPIGWSLLGNDAGADVSAIAIFGNATTPTPISSSITSIWTWDSANDRWNFYAPSMTASALSTYAGPKGYGVLSNIAKGEGFWINSNKALTLDLSTTSNATAISGIVSIGVALGGPLYLHDANGAIRQATVSPADGKYSVDVADLVAPYFLKFVDASGTVTLYSMSGQAGTANVNPLTSEIVLAAAQNVDASVADPAAVYADPAKFSAITAAMLKGAVVTVLGRLSDPIRNKLQAYGASNVDPIADSFVVGGGLDKVFAEADIRLDQAKTFMYQIQGLDRPGAVDLLRATDYGMLVVEPTSTIKGQESFDTAAMVQQLNHRPKGAPRLVLAYIDIGEAESYRAYWGADWTPPTNTARGNPDFIVAKDPDGWLGNYPVAYWDQRWKAIWLGDNGLVARMVKAGFDGVYLDWVEAYGDSKVAAAAAAAGVDPALEMIAFIEQIRLAGRNIRPDFKVVAQNALYLVDQGAARYLKAIDAVGVEDTWFRGIANAPWGDPNGGDIPNTATDAYGTQARIAQFQKYIGAGKPVFTIDYALKAENAAYVYQAAKAAGARPLVTQIELSHLSSTPPF